MAELAEKPEWASGRKYHSHEAVSWYTRFSFIESERFELNCFANELDFPKRKEIYIRDDAAKRIVHYV